MLFSLAIKKSAIYNSVAFVSLSFQSAAIIVKCVTNLWYTRHGKKVVS